MAAAAAAAQNGRLLLPPSPCPCDVKRVSIGRRAGQRARGSGTQPITGQLSKERHSEGSGAAGEEALAYVGAAAKAEGGKRRGAGRALIGRRPRAERRRRGRAMETGLTIRSS